MDEQRSVLIVDPSEETREVLQTALERRGMRILSTNRAGQGLELAQQHHPDLIVLDLEVDGTESEDLSASFAEHSRHDHTALVMLGTVRRNRAPEAEFVSKPYHYGPLVRKIEELLDTTPQPRAQSA